MILGCSGKRSPYVAENSQVQELDWSVQFADLRRPDDMLQQLRLKFFQVVGEFALLCDSLWASHAYLVC